MDCFRDRAEAGRMLAEELRAYASARPLVLALPRGGIVVADEIARALDAPLDVWVVRKVGLPWQPELGVGAVAEDGHLYLNQSILEHVGVSEAQLADVIDRERREVEARVQRFRADRRRPELSGRTVIVVDDGIATGGTVHAAIGAIRAHEPLAIVLATPVAAPETLRTLSAEVDHVVCLRTPENLRAVGYWYADFQQVPDEQVVRVLSRARRDPSTDPTDQP